MATDLSTRWPQHLTFHPYGVKFVHIASRPVAVDTHSVASPITPGDHNPDPPHHFILPSRLTLKWPWCVTSTGLYKRSMIFEVVWDRTLSWPLAPCCMLRNISKTKAISHVGEFQSKTPKLAPLGFSYPPVIKFRFMLLPYDVDITLKKLRLVYWHYI